MAMKTRKSMKRRLPYRVRVTKNPVTGLWSWTCLPSCVYPAFAYPTRAGAHRRALLHAACCLDLRAANRRALRCWNCAGRRRINDGECVVCLGKGWTREDEDHG